MKKAMARCLLGWVLFLGLLVACAEGEVVGREGGGPSKEPIDAQNNPGGFLDALERRLQALPTEGAATKVPWPGSYWPTYLDSINNRWAGSGSESPAEKYGRAFGVAGLADTVSRSHGIDFWQQSRSCRASGECDASADEVCAIRRGQADGRCIPSWFGICHAWAPASILEPEPERSVTHNGVEFKVNDLKALISLSYDQTSALMLSRRCRQNGDTSPLSVDPDGRPVEVECRDSNPGTFHTLIANYLGRLRQSFVFDLQYDLQVWNHPVKSFRVVSQRSLSAREANALVTDGRDGSDTYRFNPGARAFALVETELGYLVESDPGEDGPLGGAAGRFTRTARYTYVLEQDSQGRIVGGEWTGASKAEHPDFLWIPLAPQSRTTSGVAYANVRRLLDASLQGSGSNPGAGSTPADPLPTDSISLGWASRDGTCYRYCPGGRGDDPDGDGWGWAEEQSCIVLGSTQDSRIACSPSGTSRAEAAAGTRVDGQCYRYCQNGALDDPDGDSWGWSSDQSCVVRGSRVDTRAPCP